MENIANYFNKEILPNNTNFIYGFIYLGYSDYTSVNEELNKLMNNYYFNKIPLIKIDKKKDIKKIVKNFLGETLKILDVTKLKDIYQYYYSLNIFEDFKKVVLLNNFKNNILVTISHKKGIDPQKFIFQRLELDLKMAFNKERIEFGVFKGKIKNIYDSIFNELQKDFDNYDYENYFWEKYGTKEIFDKIKEVFINKKLPDDIISLEVSNKINELFIDIFLKKVKEKLINDSVFKISKYPDFNDIIEKIKNNFIDNKSIFYNICFAIIPSIVIVIVIIISIFLYSYFRKKKQQEMKHLEEIEEELKDIEENV